MPVSGMVNQPTQYLSDENFIGHHNGEDTTSSILQSVKEQVSLKNFEIFFPNIDGSGGACESNSL